jgi:hypothetical protein
LLGNSGFAEAQYLHVVSTTEVRVAPQAKSEVVTLAQNGDIFELKDTKGDWFEIGMFAGEYRYIQRAHARTSTEAPPLPGEVRVRRSACVEIVKAQDKAVKESETRFPSDFNRQIDFERLLYDRYELPIFRSYGIAPARGRALTVECAKNRWFK